MCRAQVSRGEYLKENIKENAGRKRRRELKCGSNTGAGR